jgi:hypothetical protein
MIHYAAIKLVSMSLTFNNVTESQCRCQYLKTKYFVFFWNNEYVKKQHAYLNGNFNVYVYNFPVEIQDIIRD